MHIGSNTLTAPALLRWHEFPEELADAFASDVGDRFVETVPTKSAASRATNIGPSETNLQLLVDATTSARPEKHQLRVADVSVELHQGSLSAIHRDQDRRFDIVEIMQSQLRARLLQAFSPFGADASPRITIDNLVVARQSWTFAKPELPQFPPTRGLEHFLAMRKWATANQMPCLLYTSPSPRDRG